ncbi:MAG: replicative DNA helicase [Lachnospiraceae bacterium]|nr:replicative DNA helicase [Lachnospiraceae bacterium]MCR4786072.1 replicative DNA helicase [Lachnospiraceae bacterium]HBB59749.1 replicative DNA helicase [Lachnospiraceae bacterium]
MQGDENIIKRIPPHSSEAERSVIGSMILDDTKEAILVATELLERSDFYEERYGLLYEAIVELFNEQKPADSVTLQEKLREKGAPAEITNPQLLAEIVDAVPTSANVRHYAQIVRDKAILRSVIRVNADIENECYKGEGEAEGILQDTEKKIFDLVQNKGRSQNKTIREIVVDTLRHIQEVAKADSKITGIPSGFDDLDEMTAGFQKTDLILVAARPSMGKTALVLNIAQYACFKKDYHCLFFSLEMSKEQLVNRLLAMESRVDSSHIRVGNLDDDEWRGIIESAGVIGQSNLAIDDTAITVAEMRSRCRRHKLEHGLDMVIIDYLQLMSSSRNSRSGEASRQQEISDISRSLKALARELQCPVIALSQLSRAVEQRPNHTPMLSDLRESGAIEQDADVVLFIYRDDYYNKEDSDRKGVADIIIAKQRNGSIGTVSLAWIAQLTKFENLMREQNNPG